MIEQITVDNTMDILVIYSETSAEFITIPNDTNPFEYILNTPLYMDGYSDKYKFAFDPDAINKGMNRNIRIGVNPFFSNIHGPIVFSYAHASLTEEDVASIINRNGLNNFVDKRIFKEREPFQGEDINIEELLYEIPKRDKFIPSVVDKNKYFVEGYESLSNVCYQFLKTFSGRFIGHFIRYYQWNYYEVGFQDKDKLIQYAQFVLDEFERYKSDMSLNIKLGHESKENAIVRLSRVKTMAIPIQKELSKIL